MQDIQSKTFWRHDTILGVCEGLGQDFGFNANWLRLALSFALLFSPVAILSAYVGLGVLVLASRLLFPARRTAAQAAAQPSAPAAQNDESARDFALAA